MSAGIPQSELRTPHSLPFARAPRRLRYLRFLLFKTLSGPLASHATRNFQNSAPNRRNSRPLFRPNRNQQEGTGGRRKSGGSQGSMTKDQWQWWTYDHKQKTNPF